MHRKLPLPLTLTDVTWNAVLILVVCCLYMSFSCVVVLRTVYENVTYEALSAAQANVTDICRYINVSTCQSTTWHNPENYSGATPHCY